MERKYLPGSEKRKLKRELLEETHFLNLENFRQKDALNTFLRQGKMTKCEWVWMWVGSLKYLLPKVLYEIMVPLADCRRQSYGKGRNMKEKNRGTQTCILHENQRARYFPWCANNMNFVVSDVVKSSESVLYFFDIVHRFWTLFSASVKLGTFWLDMYNGQWNFSVKQDGSPELKMWKLLGTTLRT